MDPRPRLHSPRLRCYRPCCCSAAAVLRAHSLLAALLPPLRLRWAHPVHCLLLWKLLLGRPCLPGRWLLPPHLALLLPAPPPPARAPPSQTSLPAEPPLHLLLGYKALLLLMMPPVCCLDEQLGGERQTEAVHRQTEAATGWQAAPVQLALPLLHRLLSESLLRLALALVTAGQPPGTVGRWAAAAGPGLPLQVCPMTHSAAAAETAAGPLPMGARALGWLWEPDQPADCNFGR